MYNEATGWYETREVELKGYTFTDDDRIIIVREYLESGVPAEKIVQKYHISSRSVLFSWMDKRNYSANIKLLKIFKKNCKFKY